MFTILYEQCIYLLYLFTLVCRWQSIVYTAAIKLMFLLIVQKQTATRTQNLIEIIFLLILSNYYCCVAHATWHHSSHLSQEQQLLLSTLKSFYRPASINYRRPQLQALLIATSSHPFKSAPFHVTSCSSPAHADALLTTSVSLPNHFSTKLLQTSRPRFFLHEDYPENLTQGFFITETSFWAAITLASSAHLLEHSTGTQECPTSSQNNLELTTELLQHFFLSPIVMHFSRPPPLCQVHPH